MSIFKKCLMVYATTLHGDIAFTRSLVTKYEKTVNHIIDQSLIKFCAGIVRIDDTRLMDACLSGYEYTPPPIIINAIKNIIATVAARINKMDNPSTLNKLALSSNKISPDLVVLELLTQIKNTFGVFAAYQDRVNTICAEAGCPPGVDCLTWLTERLASPACAPIKPKRTRKPKI